MILDTVLAPKRFALCSRCRCSVTKAQNLGSIRLLCSRLIKTYDLHPSTELHRTICHRDMKTTTSTFSVSKSVHGKIAAYLLSMLQSPPLSEEQKIEVVGRFSAGENVAHIAEDHERIKFWLCTIYGARRSVEETEKLRYHGFLVNKKKDASIE